MEHSSTCQNYMCLQLLIQPVCTMQHVDSSFLRYSLVLSLKKCLIPDNKWYCPGISAIHKTTSTTASVFLACYCSLLTLACFLMLQQLLGGIDLCPTLSVFISFIAWLSQRSKTSLSAAIITWICSNLWTLSNRTTKSTTRGRKLEANISQKSYPFKWKYWPCFKSEEMRLFLNNFKLVDTQQSTFYLSF